MAPLILLTVSNVLIWIALIKLISIIRELTKEDDRNDRT